MIKHEKFICFMIPGKLISANGVAVWNQPYH